jgi:RNA polymerase sigma-70 factor (ECF subfamily)
MSVTQPDLPPYDPDWGATFAEICDRHRGRLIRWLTSIFGARDAEDIAQEALARLYQRPTLLDPSLDAWPWLAVVARNVGRDMARHNAQSTTVDQDVLAAMPSGDSVHDQVVARDDADRLARALRSLTPRERAVITMRDFHDAAIGDIAEIFGINENAARQQLFRARRRLANAYVSLGGDRRIGLVALLGLRVREFVRRHAPYLDPFATSSAAIAAVIPALAVIVSAVGGALPGAPSATAATGAAFGTTATAGDDVRAATWRDGGTHPGAWTPTRTPARGAPARRKAPKRDPFLDYHPDAGPVHGDVTLPQNPGGDQPGSHYHAHVWVDLPNGWRWGVEAYDENAPGYGPVCGSGLVHCG